MLLPVFPSLTQFCLPSGKQNWRENWFKQDTIPPPHMGPVLARKNLNQGRENWGQEASCERWVSYRLLWAVHPTSLPQSWRWRARSDRQMQLNKCGQRGGRSGGGGWVCLLPRRKEAGRGGEHKIKTKPEQLSHKYQTLTPLPPRKPLPVAL